MLISNNASDLDDDSEERRFDITADEMPASIFFMGLVEGTPENMVINPNVTGNITLHLKNVTVEDAMEAVHDAYGYEYRRTSYGYEILAVTLESQIFTVNYLDIKRSGKSVTHLSTGQISEKVSTTSTGGSSILPTSSVSQTTTDAVSGSAVSTTSEVDFWKQLNITLHSLIRSTPGKSVVVNAPAGVVIVRAFPSELRKVGRYLGRIQSNMDRQVILEAKILEVQLNDQYQAGINWNIFGKGNPLTNDAGGSQMANGPFSGTDISDFPGLLTLNVGKGRFNLLIQLLQTQGNVQVLSSPRISTVNNQKAVIKVGQDEFFVTGVSTQTTITNNNSSIPTQDVNLTPFFSGITFDVTPQISGGDNVILHIHPAVSNVTEQIKTITLGSTAASTPNVLSLPLALSTIRESDNVVKAKNGQIIVIGGLMSNSMEEDIAGAPGLSRIPFFGSLFRRTSHVSKKIELVILLRPIIVKAHTWEENLDQTEAEFKPVKRRFHAGGLSDVFGNEGELERI